MSAMENMLASMLKSVIPPEVMALITPEKMQEFGDKINAYITEQREDMDLIKQTQMQHSDLLAAIMERLENGGCKYNGGKRGTGNGSASGNGTGSGNGSN